MKNSNELEAIEPFMGTLMAAVEPPQRKKLMDKLMRAARRANVKRIRANVQPDGSKMVPRKKRHGKDAKRGKMFRNIGKQQVLRIRTRPDAGELRFANPLVEHTAAEHHFGLKGFVGKTRDGRVIRTKYDARRLLGFGKERDELLDDVLKHLASDG